MVMKIFTFILFAFGIPTLCYGFVIGFMKFFGWISSIPNVFIYCTYGLAGIVVICWMAFWIYTIFIYKTDIDGEIPDEYIYKYIKDEDDDTI